MKIVHVAESFSAGILDFICYLTTELTQFEHVIVFGNREIKERNVELSEIKKRFLPSVSFIEWPHAEREIHPVKDLLALKSLMTILKSFHYTALHLHSSKAGFLGRAAGRFLENKNIFYTPHSAYFLRTDISMLKRKAIVYLEKLASKWSGTIVCCSKSEYQEFDKVGISATYINNGIPIAPNSLGKSTSGKFIIATSGRTFHQKNPGLFNKIASHFVANTNVQFLWIGDGYLNHLLTAPNITITGWVGRDKVYELLQQSSLYISTSLWEGLPYSVLDAMSLSKTLVLNNCVGNKDLVEDGYNGFLFNSEKEAIAKIEYLLHHPDLLHTYGNRSRSLCEKYFNLKTTAQDYATKYLKNISNQG